MFLLTLMVRVVNVDFSRIWHFSSIPVMQESAEGYQ